MRLSETHAREERRTQPAPVSLEHGRFEPGQVVRLFGLTVAGLACGAIGGLLMSVGLPGTASDWAIVAVLGLWGGIFGFLLMITGFAMATIVATLAARGWWRHQVRVDDWHYAQLEAYEAAGGQESRREVLHRSLTTTEPAHALLVALHICQQAREGTPTPWSSPRLTGPLWYRGIRLGDLSKSEAEEFSRLFGEIGAVRGRRKGFAGQLSTENESDLLQLVAQNYNKWLPGRIDRPEPEGE